MRDISPKDNHRLELGDDDDDEDNHWRQIGQLSVVSVANWRVGSASFTGLQSGRQSKTCPLTDELADEVKVKVEVEAEEEDDEDLDSDDDDEKLTGSATRALWGCNSSSVNICSVVRTQIRLPLTASSSASTWASTWSSRVATTA